MFVSVTRLRIHSIRFLPGFFLHAMRSRAQVRHAAGFREGSILADRERVFWTMTVWDDEAAMRAYMTSGAHRAAMPKLVRWCDEASVVHWSQPDPALPGWEEADRRMRGEGRPSKVRHPAPHHADLSYRPPRLTAAGPVTPAGSGR